jgi:hypothetical protein
MSEQKEPNRTSDEEDSQERIEDGEEGLEKTADLMRRLLKVPKSAAKRASKRQDNNSARH